MRIRVGFLAALLVMSAASTAHAGHHLWVFSEMYSNASGSVQYVEMFTSAASEQGVGAFTVTSGANTFNFVTNLPSSATANTHILMATSGFGSIAGGVTPDYIIPSNFFSTGGGTLNYAGGVSTWAFGAVPTDGVHSLNRDGSTGINSPQNFAGASGSVNLATTVPMVQSWGLIAAVGAILFMASGLLRRREDSTLAA